MASRKVYLNVLGCVSYMKIKDFKRDKLKEKAKKYIFIGYGLDAKGYCFWDNQNKKVIKSQNVVFNESTLYKDKIAISPHGEKKPKKQDQIEFRNLRRQHCKTYRYS